MRFSLANKTAHATRAGGRMCAIISLSATRSNRVVHLEASRCLPWGLPVKYRPCHSICRMMIVTVLAHNEAGLHHPAPLYTPAVRFCPRSKRGHLLTLALSVFLMGLTTVSLRIVFRLEWLS